MSDQLWKLIGVLVTISIFAGATVIAAFRSVYRTMQAADDQLHERVNRVRDEYVKRVDLNDHMARLESTLKEMRDEQRSFSRDMLSLLNRHRQKENRE